MQLRLEEQAKLHGRDDVVIDAMPLVEADVDLGYADLLLLSPQVRFAKDDLVKKAGSVPVLQISITDFGLMKADNVWKEISAAMGW